MKKIVLLAVALTLIAGTAFAGISGTKHDLSTTLANTTAMREICIWCHTPHGAAQGAASVAPLWSHTTRAASGFTLYSNPYGSLQGTFVSPGSLAGVSLACMSCHDGATAIGAIAYGKYAGSYDPGPNAGTYGVGSPMTGNAALGVLLDNDHPVSISYNDTDSGLKSRLSVTTTPLFPSGGNYTVECASCHDVHNNTNAPFLVMSNNQSGLCLYCHLK